MPPAETKMQREVVEARVVRIQEPLRAERLWFREHVRVPQHRTSARQPPHRAITSQLYVRDLQDSQIRREQRT